MGSFHIGQVTAAVLAVFLAASPAMPQASTAVVRGTVRDQAQAVVPGARVLLTNTATNLSRSVSSNEKGARGAWIIVFAGGLGRNRTGVHGFAGRCMTTLPPGR